MKPDSQSRFESWRTQRHEFNPEGLTQNLILEGGSGDEDIVVRLGKYKTGGCAYISESGAHHFPTFREAAQQWRTR